METKFPISQKFCQQQIKRIAVVVVCYMWEGVHQWLDMQLRKRLEFLVKNNLEEKNVCLTATAFNDHFTWAFSPSWAEKPPDVGSPLFLLWICAVPCAGVLALDCFKANMIKKIIFFNLPSCCLSSVFFVGLKRCCFPYRLVGKRRACVGCCYHLVA